MAVDGRGVTGGERHKEIPHSRAAQLVPGPLVRFIEAEVSGGIVLLGLTVLALVWANSPWGHTYEALWATRITIGAPSFGLTETLGHWVNDGLMAVFFLLVGLEIKREVLVGELASPRRAALPMVAAVGGMVVPAALYALFNSGGEYASGWGIPMATDIAFALGILSLLGRRVPLALKVLLTSLAIVDDIGAVLVIAIFYTEDLHVGALLGVAAVLVVLGGLGRLGVQSPGAYLALGVVLWVLVLESGIHATVAGVLLALMIPARSPMRPGQYLRSARVVLDEFEEAGGEEHTIMTNEERQSSVLEMERAGKLLFTPLRRLEHALAPWVTWGIIPLFALANAGLAFRFDLGEALAHPVTLGVVAGLVVGKVAGIFLFAWAAVALGLTSLPEGVGWGAIFGVGWLAGIGFTMSLFIAGLAFTGEGLEMAKLGILVASTIAAAVGLVTLRRTVARPAGA